MRGERQEPGRLSGVELSELGVLVFMPGRHADAPDGGNVPELGCCRPATAGHVLLAGQRTALVLARAAGITGHSPDRLPA